MSTSIWIVIVSYRTADLAADCLNSLISQVCDFGCNWVAVAKRVSAADSIIAAEKWSIQNRLSNKDC